MLMRSFWLLLGALVLVKAIYAPQAPGVINPLGKGQDPAPVKWYNATLGHSVYLFPDIDFAHSVYLRVSQNLSDVQYFDRNRHTVYTFKDNIATEAPDLSQTADGKWVMYISAVSINTIFVVTSDTKDPLGPWTEQGNVQHGGKDIVGYDSHALNLPNGDRYLTWSTSFHAPPSISIIKLSNVTHAQPGSRLSAIVVPDQPYEMNEIPSVNYSYQGHACCNAPVVEAPSSWVIRSTVNLGYAANWYADATYNTLVTTASTKSDLLNAASWTKSPHNPILYSDFYTNTYAPGSGGFFEGPDNDVWFAYGAINNATGFTNGPNIRTVRAQKMGYDKEGKIRRTAPVNATRPIPGSSYNDQV